jgi:hypothetical protein
MERVVYLEPDDEITSVLDKLEKTEEESVILVIPSGATILQSLVNLKLLSKKAIELKKEIALVTSDKIGRNLASLAGLSVYSNLKEKGKIIPKEPRLPAPPGVVVKTYSPSLERTEEPKPAEPLPPKPPKPPKPPFRFPSIPFGFWIALIGSFILVLLVLYLFLPRATVVLGMKTTTYTQSLEIIVDQKAKEVDFENKTIPGEPQELEKEGSQKWQATGKKNIGGKAKGTITVTNSFKNPDGSGQEFSLKAGTEFKDKKTGKSFLSDSAVTVPRLTYDINNGQPIPGTASVKVTAVEPGESYNIGPSQFSIPNLGTSSVSGASSENMSGGYDKLVTVVSEDDINKAKEEISKDLISKAKEELKKKLKKGQKLLEGAVLEETEEALPSVKAGTQTSEFEMKVKVKISTLVVNEEEYKSLLAKFLEDNLPTDKRLVSTPSDSTELVLIDYNPQFQVMRIKATLNTQIVSKINEERLKEEISKKSSQEAKSYLEAFEEIESASIKLWPFWAKKLPVPSRIKIQTKP